MLRYYVVNVRPGPGSGCWEVRDRQDKNFIQRYVTRKQARIGAWMRNNPEPKKSEATLAQD